MPDPERSQLILKDARGVRHDLGPVHSVTFSEMKMIGTASTGRGRWNGDMSGLFTRSKPRVERPPRPVKVKAAPVLLKRTRPAARVRPPRLARFTPEETRARKNARSDAYNKSHRLPVPMAVCVQCGVEFKARQPRRAKYCTDLCRGRYGRANKG